MSAARLRLAAVAAAVLGGGLSPAVPVERNLPACSMELETKTNEAMAEQRRATIVQSLPGKLCLA